MVRLCCGYHEKSKQDRDGGQGYEWHCLVPQIKCFERSCKVNLHLEVMCLS